MDLARLYLAFIPFPKTLCGPTKASVHSQSFCVFQAFVLSQRFCAVMLLCYVHTYKTDRRKINWINSRVAKVHPLQPVMNEKS